ncbi:MAG: cytochrome b [Pseudomonadota bacterium]
MAASAQKPQTRYTTVAIVLHWAIAVMIVGQIAGGLYMSGLPFGNDKFALYQLHKSFGLVVLVLSLVRLGWRLGHKPPALPDHMTPRTRFFARATHVAFYVLMISVPLGGWALVSASPYADSVPTLVFGLFEWPHLPFFETVGDREALAEQIAGTHKFFGLAIAALLALHVAAALKHHFKDRDGVLASMAPGVRAPSS